MDISNASAASVSALINSAQPQPPAPKNEKQPEDQSEKQQDSAKVKLSAQAQQMSRAENQNNNTERAAVRPQEVAEPAGIQFMAGEKKGGRVDTFV